MDWAPLCEGDPIPGDPAGIVVLAARLRAKAVELRDIVSALSGISADGIWTGEAADQFAKRRESVGPDLELVAARYDAAAKALEGFHPAVGDAQGLARTPRRRRGRRAVGHRRHRPQDPRRPRTRSHR